MCSENKGADQLRSYCEADLLFFFAWFPHEAAHSIALAGFSNM